MIEHSNINDLLENVTTKEDVGRQLLMLYGQINQEVIVSTIKLAEKKLVLENVPISLVTKAKIVCTEMLQNILQHQTKHDTFLPNFIIRLTQDGLSIATTNIITEEDKSHITKQLDVFSKISKEEFRNFYVEAFRDASMTDSGNAGLGLLDIVYRSKQCVKYKMEKIAAGLFSFNLDVTISQPAISIN